MIRWLLLDTFEPGAVQVGVGAAMDDDDGRPYTITRWAKLQWRDYELLETLPDGSQIGRGDPEWRDVTVARD